MTQKVDIPDTLPTFDQALDLFCAWRDEPNEHLMGLRLLDTFGNHSDVDRIWVVGSNAWYPAVLGKAMDRFSDIDLVFHDTEAAMVWANMLVEQLSKLNKSRYPVTIGTNIHGGAKVSRGGIAIADAWGLEPNESIAEHLCYFKQQHERCAFSVTAHPGEIAAMTRVVKLRSTPRKTNSHYEYGGS